MPRRTRKAMVGRQEDVERREREREYKALGWVLRVEWRERMTGRASDEIPLTAISQ